MNIFYLDRQPKTCAEMHLDKHVVPATMLYPYFEMDVENLKEKGYIVP